MILFHTSPTKITTINRDGRFGEFLFFSDDVYVMTASDNVHVYKLDINSDEIIEASQLFYVDDSDQILKSLIDEVKDMLGVDDETACDLIDETVSIYDIDTDVSAEDLADCSWEIQRITATAAKMLGYKGVQVEDEQGAAYMIDMLGRESLLQTIIE